MEVEELADAISRMLNGVALRPEADASVLCWQLSHAARKEMYGTALARLVAGDSFGELGLLQHRRRSATVRAVEPVDVLVLGRSDFDLLAGTWTHLNESLVELARERTQPEA